MDVFHVFSLIGHFLSSAASEFHSDAAKPKPETASVYLILTDRREFCEIQTEVG